MGSWTAWAQRTVGGSTLLLEHRRKQRRTVGLTMDVGEGEEEAWESLHHQFLI